MPATTNDLRRRKNEGVPASTWQEGFDYLAEGDNTYPGSSSLAGLKRRIRPGTSSLHAGYVRWLQRKRLIDGFTLVAAEDGYEEADGTPTIRLELILEGPEGAAPATRTFFAVPTAASSSQRSEVVDLGLARDNLGDFLARLTIVPQYHARPSIDAVTIRLLMVLVPGRSADIEALYETLLQRVIAAHTGSAASADPEHPLALLPGPDSSPPNIVNEHMLSRAELLTILPPVPVLEAEQRQLLEAANGGALAMIDLEWKLRVAGAGETTVARAKARRSSASIRLAERPTLTGDVDEELERLADRLLEHADAVVADVVGTASSTAQASRPAEIIYGRLVQQTTQLGTLDQDGVLGGDGGLVLGFLCELSDQCGYA